jgi:hypothetical protein
MQDSLQEATAGVDGARPAWLVVQAQAGYGTEKPTAKNIEQWNLMLCFLTWTLRLSVVEGDPLEASSGVSFEWREKTRLREPPARRDCWGEDGKSKPCYGNTERELPRRSGSGNTPN